MTSEEIQQIKLSLLGEAANTIWLQEIAYQLAVMNERAENNYIQSCEDRLYAEQRARQREE
jgi:hypothetical protein